MPFYLPAIPGFMRRSFPRKGVPPVAPAGRGTRLLDWKEHGLSPLREYVEVLGVLVVVTVAGWFSPFSYHAYGLVYLLAVIMLCLRVGRWPVLVAAVVSAVAWDFLIIPPRLSFAVLDLEDVMILGTYFVVAIIAGQVTARIRAQEHDQRQREQRATALFHLTRALTGSRTLDEAVGAALRQADEIFGAETALLLPGGAGGLAPHAASSFRLDELERNVAECAWREARETGRYTANNPRAAALHLPLLRAGAVLGVLVLCLPVEVARTSPAQRELLAAFAAQVALLIEREQLRAASQREQLLAESDRLHRTLLDCVSHELKTPLAVLRSAAESLGRETGARRAELAGEILTAASRLDRVVANLLNQTRLESGAVKPQPDWCDARDLINAARRGLGDALAGRPVRIEIPADMPLFMADAPLMEQVLTNLLHNAVRYTPAGSALVVSAGVDEANQRVFLAVADHGPGIPAAIRGHLFQKFRRGSETQGSGLGLGLSIVRGFMLAQGGEVVAESLPGQGAKFTVYLPYTLHETVPHE